MKIKLTLSFLICSFSGVMIQAQISHQVFDELLQKYVNQTGRVNYSGFKADEAKLDKYLSVLKTNHPDKKTWTRNERLSYWINAYNAFTIKAILEEYPIQSITELADGNIWDVKWIKIGSNMYSLNGIEHEVIRTNFKEPRIHFAVNCAANSCPPLLNKAYQAASLEQQLQEQADAFINNKSFNILEPNDLVLSKIFEWYADDFGSLQEYINPFTGIRINPNASITFAPYDWSLNQVNK